MVEWVYKGYLAMSDNNFVVYAYVRSKPDRFGREGTFYYIGKGRPGRPYQCGKSRTTKCPKDKENNIIVLHQNLDENTAFNYEKALIKFYGRIDIFPEWGILRNKTDGGEGFSGLIVTEERRRQMSKIGKSRFKDKRNNPMFGKKHSEETKKLISSRVKQQALSGRDHPSINLHNWTHPEHGDFYSLTILELIEMFPELNLKYPSLNYIAQGLGLSCKGWRLLQNKSVLEEERYNSIKKFCTWEHQEHGVYEDISAPDLVKIFPELNRQSLSNLSNGKIKEYKGWKCLNVNENNYTHGPLKSDWEHDEFGVFLNYTISQLCEKFKNLNLTPSKLRLVRIGKVKQHKGWKIHN